MPPLQPSHAIQEVGKCLTVFCLSGEHTPMDSTGVLCLRSRGRGQVAALIEDLLSVGVVVGHSLGVNFSQYRGRGGRSGVGRGHLSICHRGQRCQALAKGLAAVADGGSRPQGLTVTDGGEQGQTDQDGSSASDHDSSRDAVDHRG